MNDQNHITQPILCSLFKDFNSYSHEISLYEIHTIIQSDQYKTQVEQIQNLKRLGNKDGADALKRKLPAFTPSGSFPEGRTAQSFKGYSGYIVLDFDNIPDSRLPDAFIKICHDPLTLLCFRSPGGNGLKVIIRVSTEVEKHVASFKALANFYSKLINHEVDISGKDVSRLCFMSHDPNAYFNDAAQIFEKITPEPIPPINVEVYRETFKEAVRKTELTSTFQEGNRNNFVFRLAINSKQAGIPEQVTLYFLKENYHFNEAEVKQANANAYKKLPELPVDKNATPKTHILKPGFAETGLSLLSDLMERCKNEPPIPFIFSGIKKNSFGFVFGPSKSGKTTFCENLGMALAAQLPSFLGQDIAPGQYKVLYISLEEYWQNRTTRNGNQVETVNSLAGNDTWIDNYVVINEQVPRQISTDDEWAEIEKMIVFFRGECGNY